MAEIITEPELGFALGDILYETQIPMRTIVTDIPTEWTADQIADFVYGTREEVNALLEETAYEEITRLIERWKLDFAEQAEEDEDEDGEAG